MDVVRFLVHAIGLGIVAAALVVLYYTTEIGEVLPVAVLVAALLIVVGVGLMAGIGRFGPDATVVERRRW